MSEWNYNEPPKSYEAMMSREIKGKTQHVRQVVSVYILAAYPDGKTVARTRWLPDVGRWEGFTKAEAPLAWMHYPKHPNLPVMQ